MITPSSNEDNNNELTEEEILEAFNNMYFERGGIVEEIISTNLKSFDR